jgi:hypothetical protein
MFAPSKGVLFEVFTIAKKESLKMCLNLFMFDYTPIREK